MELINNTNVHLYILNEKNKLITEEIIINILQKYGFKYKPKNITNFQRAMIHKSYLHINSCTDKLLKNLKNVSKIEKEVLAIPLQDFSYERLQFLGDSVIHLIIAMYLFTRYPNEDEGFMTKLRTKLENGDTLSILSKKLELNEYMIIARNIEQLGGRYNNVTILEDIFESFIGALYLEAGFELCKTFIINIIEKEIDITDMIYIENNYKDMLMQHFHTLKWKDPIYHHHQTIEEGTIKKFIILVKRKETDEVLGKGCGTSKKQAEKNAAKNILKSLKILKNEEESDIEDYYGV